MSAYGPLAASYDRLTRDVPYGEILAFAQMLLTERGLKPRSVLDLACGTGAMSLLLAKAGYQVTGVDLFLGSFGLSGHRNHVYFQDAPAF